ncbi:MAG TPA: hypothetical protein VKI41_15385 [Vicinamibacteria bacterium]|nr:hypothetical protein [Vicinamibacteria bacterium]
MACRLLPIARLPLPARRGLRRRYPRPGLKGPVLADTLHGTTLNAALSAHPRSAISPELLRRARTVKQRGGG